MRFVTFTTAGGAPATGVLRGEQVLDLSHPACAAVVGGVAPTLLQMVEQGLARWADRLSSFQPPAEAL
ncbi:MAG: Fumarylacetoacetate hydrolase family protein, partial [Ramlibacter sp.]|nr:Fumarylacetoacetate hydrolase family protein [Ramlibacter sp.]